MVAASWIIESMNMTPLEYYQQVVEPNVIDALTRPDSPQAASNAILTIDALAGITFWYLHGKGDTAATMHGCDDSSYKADLAEQSSAFRALRDAAFSLKHGRLTRGRREMSDAKQMTQDVNVLGYFRVGDMLGGSLVYLDLTSGRAAARDLIAEANKFMKMLVAGLP
jgi:hypothetical protein